MLERSGTPALLMRAIDYDALVDTMFHLIRQNAQTSAAVLVRMLEVLIAVVGCEREPTRVATLQRHADLVLGDAERNVSNPAATTRNGREPGATRTASLPRHSGATVAHAH